MAEDTYDEEELVEDGISNEGHPWYKHSMVMWELAKQLQHKYLSIRKANPHYESGSKDPKKRIKNFLVRYLLGYNPELIVKSIVKYGGFQPDRKLYFDLTCWQNEPMFSFQGEKRAIQRKDFLDNWQNYFAGYDYAIDIDSTDGDPKTAWQDARIIKAFFDEHKIPYSVKFSGSKGFHFLIPYRFLPPRIKDMNLPKYCNNATNWLVNRYNLPCVDDSIYDHRRILKLAYSLDGKYVCLPLDDQQFDNWQQEHMTMGSVLAKCKLFKRDLLIRDHGLPMEDLRKNVNKFFKQDFTTQKVI